jgi:hypothetical protein
MLNKKKNKERERERESKTKDFKIFLEKIKSWQRK